MQLAPEQCEMLRMTLRSLSEADMERCFKLVNEIREEKRVKATYGIAEIQRVMSEIWHQLLPKRHVPGMHRNKREDYRRNYYIGKCMEFGEIWNKLFPQLLTVFEKKPFLTKFLHFSRKRKMHSFIFNRHWKKLVICRCGNCNHWVNITDDWKRK